MELCKNGKSLRMGFIIRRKVSGQTVAVISAIIPIDRMDDENAWWKYGVLAYLHDRNMPTHDGERALYTATPDSDYGSRHAFVKKALEARAEKICLEKAEKLRQREAKKAEKAAKKANTKPIPSAQYTLPICQNCGYNDPQYGKEVVCPNCG